MRHEAMSAPGPWTLSEALHLAARAPEWDTAGLRFLDRRGSCAVERSWRDVLGDARRWSRHLAARDVGHGDRVALILQTGPEFFGAFFGVALRGAVPVPLYPPVRLGGPADFAARTAAMMRAAGVKLLISERRILPRLREVLDLAPPDGGVLDVSDERLAAAGSADASTSVTGDDAALVQFSSGTTGSPRPVVLSHRALLAQARILNSFWPEPPGGGPRRHRGVSWLPLYHDMGLVGCVLPALLRPSTLSLLSPETFVARPATWLRAISDEKATISAAPDFAYRLCLERVRDEQLEGVDLSHWEFALNGAEAVSASTLRRFAERFAPWGLRPTALTPVYGLAEAALAVTFADPARPFVAREYDRAELVEGQARRTAGGVELVSVGRPVPTFEVEIRRDDRAVADGQVGEVWARGPSLFSEYQGLPDATRATLRDGWMNTGDLGFLEDGELFLAGREKDVLVLQGRKYDPIWAERAAARVEGVVDGGVVAASWVPGDAEGESLVLLAEVEPAAQARSEELRAACRREVLDATGLRAKRVQLLELGSLPKTSSGKNRRLEALQSFLRGELAVVGEEAEA